jgi:Fur family ferric uptake transcriptional regulator
MTTSNQELRKAGLKVTLPRVKILELLESSPVHHMSAEDVYRALLEQGEDVGLATVYRVLTQFESAGIVERFRVRDGPRRASRSHRVCQLRQSGRVP